MPQDTNSAIPLYNLKAVVRDTGLKPDTIRAWERRYGLPEPERTQSGHRLYSQNDIEMLKWLVARQTEGMSISRAVELWRQRAAEAPQPNTRVTAYAPPAAPTTSINTLEHLRTNWLAACLQFDEQHADQILAQCFALFPVETVCYEVLQAGLAAVGDGWYQGTITVQQEHFMSALVARRLETLIAGTPPPTRPNRILIGCPPDERHTFAPMLLTLLMRRRGWDVVSLGADIPLANLGATLHTVRPQLVVLVAQQLPTAATLFAMSQLLLSEEIPLAFGGKVFSQLPKLRQRIPGHFLGDQLAEAAQQIEKLLVVPRAPHTPVPVTGVYQAALRAYQLHLPQIEAAVWKQINRIGLEPAQLVHANQMLYHNMSAALSLGDLDFLRPQFAWTIPLLQNHFNISATHLLRYIQSYQAALRVDTPRELQFIASWLDKLIQFYATRIAAEPVLHTS